MSDTHTEQGRNPKNRHTAIMPYHPGITLCRACCHYHLPTPVRAIESGAATPYHTGKNSRYVARSQGAETSSNQRCPRCGSFSIILHPELFELSLAHIDCDAFFAAVEKRDRPELKGRPVIVGRGARGVVAAACYNARAYGVRSAMPIFKALNKCPHAVIIKPNFEKYRVVSQQIRARMQRLTPLVEPVSVDEAFLDLSGTTRLHNASPAELLVRLARDIGKEIGISVSIGLSYNRFLAKIASDMDKPRGFFVIGKEDALSFLAPHPISLISGIGPAMQRKFERYGYRKIGDIQNSDPGQLTRNFGEQGTRLFALAQGHDPRAIRPGGGVAKSVSSETTFAGDLTSFESLSDMLWGLCEKTSKRLKDKGLSGAFITLKLRRADFRVISRRQKLERPSNLARVLFETGKSLLRVACTDMRGPYRLIGLEVSNLVATGNETQYALFSDPNARLARREKAIDRLRERFGDDIISAGRHYSLETAKGIGQTD